MITAVPVEITTEFHSGRTVCPPSRTAVKFPVPGAEGTFTDTEALGSNAARTSHASGTRNATPTRTSAAVAASAAPRPRGAAWRRDAPDLRAARRRSSPACGGAASTAPAISPPPA